MTVIRTADTRRSETPSGVMTTLASPTLGDAERPVWRVDVAPQAPKGPLHVIDAEQIWTFLTGGADVDIAEERVSVGPGDTLVIPGGVDRQVLGHDETGFSAIVTSAPGARARVAGADGEGIVPPWIA
jgi:mannose-6-phosphate isomerase-like protein (cupin superfamily)